MSAQRARSRTPKESRPARLLAWAGVSPAQSALAVLLLFAIKILCLLGTVTEAPPLAGAHLPLRLQSR
eukprot:1581452-Rhodomonas_salina.1